MIDLQEGDKSMNIDDYLGDFNSRYFGIGHKETEYRLEYSKEDNIEYNFSLKQNGIWSKKRGQTQKAHLSTIDGLILANLATQEYLQNELKVNIENIYLAKFEIRAGNSPIENLNKVSVIGIEKN